MRFTVAALLLGICVSGYAQDAKRPKITGIDHVDFYTTEPGKNAQLYSSLLGLTEAKPAEPNQSQRFLVGRTQWVGYSPAPDASIKNHLDHVAFATDDAAALKRYLAGKGIQVPSALTKWPDGSQSFRVKDPEDHAIEFIQNANSEEPKANANAVSRHMIHAGFVVANRELENKFYVETLGFRPYWFGGMKDDKADWVALQVPDGHDWLEYMLNIKADASQQTIGVMNHISLGVADIKKAEAAIASRGWKSNDREHSQLGRDGKYQLNLYDPDMTRIELMEFKPAEKPCCSEFTAPHPEVE